MFLGKIQKRYVCRAFFALAAGLLSGCAANVDGGPESVAVSTQLLTEYAPNQANVNRFYAYDNIVNIRIEMSAADWLALKTQVPNPPTCNHLPVDANGESPDRFTWFNTTKVQVSGNKYLTTAVDFTKVQVRKRSYCGSLTTGANEKPSLKLRFDTDTNSTTLTNQPVKAMGLQYVELHNSKQDPSYIRQTFGYYLFGRAGLPHSRANYAKVQVVTESGTENLVYVNVEPIRASFINNPDNGFANRTVTQSGNSDAHVPGTLYEIEGTNDFNAESFEYMGVEKVSGVRLPSKPDLAYAEAQIRTRGVGGLMEVVNVDQFARFWAMEVLLKHWDGYTQSPGNNSYIYNDAVATPGTQSDSSVDFKFIPWGIDQILQDPRNYRITNSTVVTGLARNDPELYAKFVAAVSDLRLNLFSRALIEGELKTRINTLNSQLLGLGLDTTSYINEVRTQLKLARSTAMVISGYDPGGLYLVDRASGDVLHAGNTPIPNSSVYYEVYRRPWQDASSDRWQFVNTPIGLSIRSEAYGRALEAASTLMTPAGHRFLFTVAAGSQNTWNSAWFQQSPDYIDQFNFHPASIYGNAGTGGYIRFAAASDLTPAGQLRAYQSDQANATRLFMY